MLHDSRPFIDSFSFLADARNYPHELADNRRNPHLWKPLLLFFSITSSPGRPIRCDSLCFVSSTCAPRFLRSDCLARGRDFCLDFARTRIRCWLRFFTSFVIVFLVFVHPSFARSRLSSFLSSFHITLARGRNVRLDLFVFGLFVVGFGSSFVCLIIGFVWCRPSSCSSIYS